MCVSFFLFCLLLIWPELESGLTDDWSTVRTAQLLAETGHIHYNGWEAAMLGWPLYVAAAFIRLFGPSFRCVRATNALEAAAAVVLMHRVFVRSGLTALNASVGVLAVVCTPMFLLASVLFMTDIPGLLAILMCLYGCLRALEAAEPRAAAGWTITAALSNAVLGTSRQIAWLGVLVMVPCAAWLLRRSRLVVWAGVVSCFLSYGFIAVCLRWFNHQPYILVAPLLPGSLRSVPAVMVVEVALRTALDTILFLLPVLVAFLPSLLRSNRRTWYAMSTVALGGCAVGLRLALRHSFRFWLPPWLIFPYVHPQTVENTFTMTTMPMKGPAPFPLPLEPRVAVLCLVLAGVACLVAGLTASPTRSPEGGTELIRLRSLLWLIIPFLLVYFMFLISRGLYNFVYDRYLLPVLPLLVLLLLRWHQAREAPRLPAACGVLIAALAVYSVLTLHNTFACYRAALAACDEITAAGYPRTAVDGGWEYNHWSQILAGGYVHQVGVRMPDGHLLPDLDSNTVTPCSMDVREWTPDLHPRFTLGYPGTRCEPVHAFAPVHFRTWLPPRAREVEVYRYSLEGPLTPQATER